MQGGPFNTKFYRSKSDETWWTTDVAGHGGSVYKVYKQEGGKLVWKFDADMYGDRIDGKWKGGMGRVIPMKDLGGAG